MREAGAGIRAGAKMALRLSPPGAVLGAGELDQLIRKTGGRVSGTHSPEVEEEPLGRKHCQASHRSPRGDACWEEKPGVRGV